VGAVIPPLHQGNIDLALLQRLSNLQVVTDPHFNIVHGHLRPTGIEQLRQQIDTDIGAGTNGDTLQG